jgi:hypothetical protein
MHSHFEMVSKHKLRFGVKRISDLGPGVARRLGSDSLAQGLPRGQDAASGFGAFLGGDARHPSSRALKRATATDVVMVGVGQDQVIDSARLGRLLGCDEPSVQESELRLREARINDQSLVPGKQTH